MHACGSQRDCHRVCSLEKAGAGPAGKRPRRPATSDGDLQSCAVTVLNLPTSTTKATLAAFFTRRAADGADPAEHVPHTIRVGM